MSPNYPTIKLKNKREESVKRKHPWIFSGAIDSADREITEGDKVKVSDSHGNIVGVGHSQTGSIAVRLLDFSDCQLDANWYIKKIEAAYKLRVNIGIAGRPDTDCYRLVHGEGDSLPGLIIDMYGRHSVVQFHSPGMYEDRELIKTALIDVLKDKIRSIYSKSLATLHIESIPDHYLYKNEDIEDQNYIATENNLKFYVDWVKGQKTGFFLDQRENRELLKKYAKGKRVLNTFCYTGGFSVYAMAGGASYVESVDSSAHAISMTNQNIELNFPSCSNHSSIVADAVEYVRNRISDFDVIILDPPAFAKNRSSLKNALQAYKRLNFNAITNINSGGIIFTFSCSQAVSKEAFRTTVFSAAAMSGRNVRILHQLTQPSDHPVNIYHPEGEYLKGLVLYVE